MPLGVISRVSFEILSDFGENRKRAKKTGIWANTGPYAAA